MCSEADRCRIAVVGGGVAGITAAYLLQQRHEVTLFEREERLGGHTNTVVISDGPDEGTAIDTGFIVLNDTTYPLLHALLRRLGVGVRWSDMSFSYHCEHTGFHYAGTSLNGLFADRSNILRPSYYRFLAELARFCREGLQAVAGGVLEEIPLRRYLELKRYSKALIDSYVVPMGAAIWSAPRDEMLAFPAETYLRFFHNHGLLSLSNRPRWQTVAGGSHSYLQRFCEQFSGTIERGAPVRAIERGEDVTVITADNRLQRFHKVVIAAHADQALKLLADPTADERRLLGAWRYQRNRTVLHRGVRALPPNRRAWASWNYIRQRQGGEASPVTVTYHMNRLQGLATRDEYCVSLNREGPIAPGEIVYETEYEHPVYSLEAVRLQQDLPRLNGPRNTYFCGSYFGYGFHEDAVRSGAAVGMQFGVSL